MDYGSGYLYVNPSRYRKIMVADAKDGIMFWLTEHKHNTVRTCGDLTQLLRIMAAEPLTKYTLEAFEVVD